MNEEWRPVLDYEGLFEVSSKGRIRSIYSKGPRKIPLIRKTQIDWLGYPAVNLYKNGKYRWHKVHKLVLEAFKGKRPNGMEAAHEDGNKLNACIDNLSWKTRTENERDKIRHGTIMRGSRHHSAKLNEKKVIKIRELHKTGAATRSSMAKKYGVAKTTINAILSRKTWSHIL